MEMQNEHTVEALRMFDVPAGDDKVSRDVRAVLARLIAKGALTLGELQVARDLMRRTHSSHASGYLFLAAMWISLHKGNVFFRDSRGAELLKAEGYTEGEGYRPFAETVDALWPKAVRAAGGLRGDAVVNPQEGCWFFVRNLESLKAVTAALNARRVAVSEKGALKRTELETATTFSFSLKARQVDSVKKVAERNFVVITGGPGTGKTTIVCAFLRALLARGDVAADQVALAAPTGRAAQRMGEALRSQCRNARTAGRPEKVQCSVLDQIENLEGSTIHSLLGGLAPNWRHTRDNPLPYKLVVVDEVSMVDLQLMEALLEALTQDCRLVLLGDKDQLPSVEAGAVLGDLVGDQDADFVVCLNESNRFTGDLARAAESVNAGDTEKLKTSLRILHDPARNWLAEFEQDSSKNTCYQCELGDTSRPWDLQGIVVDWAQHFGLLDGGRLCKLAEDFPVDDAALTEGVSTEASQELFEVLDSSRILSVVRQGGCGVQGINDFLIRKRYGGRIPVVPLGKPGVPVLITRNTRERGLFNGDVGVTVKGGNGMVVLFPRGDRTVACPVALLPEHELAYALTVHKSQGSEFGNVMVVLPNDVNHPLLNRQIVYTGITRAKERAVIVGSADALSAAMARRMERDTGIAWA